MALRGALTAPLSVRDARGAEPELPVSGASTLRRFCSAGGGSAGLCGRGSPRTGPSRQEAGGQKARPSRRSAGSWRGCRGARRGRAVPGSRSVSGRGAALGGPPRRPPAPPHAGWLPSLTDKKGFCFKYFSTKTASGNTEFLKTLSSLFDKKSGSALL